MHIPPVEFLSRQLETLGDDLTPMAIKVGMIPTKESAMEVGRWIRECKTMAEGKSPLAVVVDPVMISTSGHRLVDFEAKMAMVTHVFPHADLITPNKFEAEELLGRKLVTTRDVEEGAREILTEMGPKAVLIKGGHALLDEESVGSTSHVDGLQYGANDYAQDYLLTDLDTSLAGKPVQDQPRLCDGSRGVWLRSKRCVDHFLLEHWDLVVQFSFQLYPLFA